VFIPRLGQNLASQHGNLNVSRPVAAPAAKGSIFFNASGASPTSTNTGDAGFLVAQAPGRFILFLLL